MAIVRPLLAVIVAVAMAAGLAGCAGSSRNKEDILYTAIGASDAVGIGAVPLTNGYVYRIEDALQARSRRVQLLNLGIPGADAEIIKDAVRAALKTGIKPDLVTIWIGANDIIKGVDPDDFEADLDKILDALRDETSAFIVIANIPDLTELPRFRARPLPTVTRERVDDFNRAIEERADDFDVPVVDLFEEEITDDLVSDKDGFHPSNEGHEAIANRFLEVILPAFGLSS